MAITINDLRIGDVIFTLASQKPPALHTQLYIGDAHFPATILHAVDDTRPQGPSKLMATSIKSSSDYQVFRCIASSKLIDRAVKYACRWTQFQTPYDQERKYLKEAYRNFMMATGADSDVVRHMRQLFDSRGKFRAMKYAARRDDILCYPNEEGSSRGLTCTMFVILCFQVAGIAKAVRKTRELAPGSAMVRVSDKKLNQEEIGILRALVRQGKLNASDLEAYLRYADTLKVSNEYGIDWEAASRDERARRVPVRRSGYQYFPSLLCWHSASSVSNFDFAAAMTDGMLVDAKIATSEHLRACLEADKAGWKNLGFLDSSVAAPSDPRYKEKMRQFESHAESLRSNRKPLRPISIKGQLDL